jgi:hypothetical protein
MPPPRSRQRLDQRAVRLRLASRHDRGAVRRDDPLAAAAALERHRDADGQPTPWTPRFAALAIAVKAEDCAPPIGDAFLHEQSIPTIDPLWPIQ